LNVFVHCTVSSELPGSSISKLELMHYVSTCATIFLTCILSGADIISIALILQEKDVCSKPTDMASDTVSLNELPDEIFLQIFSHFGAEELSLIFPKVCKRWNNLAKDKALWKKISYHCDDSSDPKCIDEVRCNILLVLRTN